MSTDEQMLEELREIRKLLTPAPPPEPPDNFIQEFVEFIKKYKVLGLATAFILALYLGQVVNSLVDNIIMPIVEIALPDISWESIVLFDAFRIGLFLSDLVTFIIIAFVVFIIVKIASRIGIE